MPSNSKREQLGTTYKLLCSAGDTNWLVQALGPTPVRVVAMADGGEIPADNSPDYFIISHGNHGSDAISREGMQGADIYGRSDIDKQPAFVTRISS